MGNKGAFIRITRKKTLASDIVRGLDLEYVQVGTNIDTSIFVPTCGNQSPNPHIVGPETDSNELLYLNNQFDAVDHPPISPMAYAGGSIMESMVCVSICFFFF